MKKFTYVLLLILGGVSSLFAQPVADFGGFPLTQCNPPYEVTFENYSQGDTAWHWDFGDGNTSFFPNPIHLYNTTGVFTVTLISYGPTGSDTLIKTNYVTTLAPPADPSLNRLADTVNCGSNSRFIATGVPELVWYDQADQVIAIGDTLDLPIVTQSSTYYVQSEDESAPMFVGPKDPTTVGPGGIFNGDQAMTFNVLGDIRLKSVLVEAQGAGIREFTLEDTFGVILKTIPVFVPNGKGRIYLNLELFPGNYRLRGNGVNLFRNNNGGTAYPYEISGLIEITGSTAGAGFYYYFYDWEVTTFCKSNKVAIEITANPIAAATTVQDTVTVPCGSGAELIATAPSAVLWYDSEDTEVGRGDTLKLPLPGGSATYYARNAEQSGVFSFGPQDPDSLGNGAFFNSNDNAWLFFRVSSSINLQSVWVHANTAGSRSFEIIDQNGDIVQTYSMMVPAGKSRINLNTELGAGVYQIGGSNLDFFRNENVATSYPYSLGGVASITGSSAGRDFYNFFYDWEVTTVCLSEADSVYLRIDAGPAPVLAIDSIGINCADDVVFVATGSQVIWYDQNDRAIATGDSLKLQNVSFSSSYSARNVAAGTSQKVGPMDGNSLGNGGYFGFFFPNGLTFEVYTHIRLKSVWVDAGSAGSRDILLNDGNGSLLQTITVNIPAGISRVILDLELEAGTYELAGANLDLFRNTDGFSFPYTLPGLLSITDEVGFGGPGGGQNYYFFYDWEVASICKSDPVTANVTVAPLASPTVTGKDTLCYEEQALFTASSPTASWYGPSGDFLGRGKSIQTAPLTSGGTFTVKAEGNTPIQHLGPANGAAVGAGTYDESPFPSFLQFTVYVPIRINSFLVDADIAGSRRIEIVDFNGGMALPPLDVFIESGSSRVNWGIEIQPGTYFMGGDSLNLFRNTNGAAYPYDITGLISITGTLGGFPGSPEYNHFYDWEVQELPCTSNDVSFDVYVNPQLTSSFSFSKIGDLFSFNNTSSQGSSYLWDFGDGNTATTQNAAHTYTTNGSHTVTLTISDGICDAVSSQTVEVSGVAIDPLLAQSFQLFPNPGTGRFTIKAEAAQASKMYVQIFDFTGRRLFISSPKHTANFEELIDLSDQPAGAYFLHFQANETHIVRKYVLIK